MHDMSSLESLNDNFEQEKGTLISYIGHEFKTPLTNCIGFIQLLKHSKNDEQKKKYIHLIEKANIQLVSIVNNTIDYSKLLLNKLKLCENKCNISKCIHESINIVRGSLNDNSKISINYNVDDKLDEYIQIDENRLKQLLINVLLSILNIICKKKQQNQGYI